MTVVLAWDRAGRWESVEIRCDTCTRSVGSNVLSEDALREAVLWAALDAGDLCTECQQRRGMKSPYLVRIGDRAGRLG